jgi:predicted Fe-Mo cluster-binding NifX family protein/ferredoxin
MKIAVTATGATLEAPLDLRFGRCPYFVIVETDNLNFEAVPNPSATADSGAGIQAAQLVAGTGAKFVLTGNCGPNAYQTLSAAGLGVIVGCSGTVRNVVENFKAGRYSATEQPNVASHFGSAAASNVSNGPPPEAQSPTDFTPGVGMGRGMGRGGGGGGGMGMGRGMGRGGGGGRGMGRGMGRGGGGRGMGMGRGNMSVGLPTGSVPQTSQQSQPNSAQELDALKAQAQTLEEQLAALNERMGQIGQGETTRRLVAVVDAESCTGCGLCAQTCPTNAISVNTVAVVDVGLCTACGQCVAECPQEAISLRKAIQGRA